MVDPGQAFVAEVMALSDEWERVGWLRKFQDADGKLWWDLTPAGRQALDLPPRLEQ